MKGGSGGIFCEAQISSIPPPGREQKSQRRVIKKDITANSQTFLIKLAQKGCFPAIQYNDKRSSTWLDLCPTLNAIYNCLELWVKFLVKRNLKIREMEVTADQFFYLLKCMHVRPLFEAYQLHTTKTLFLRKTFTSSTKNDPFAIQAYNSSMES